MGPDSTFRSVRRFDWTPATISPGTMNVRAQPVRKAAPNSSLARAGRDRPLANTRSLEAPLQTHLPSVIVAALGGPIIRCAHGFPGYMSQGPPSASGSAGNPVVAGVANGM
jgi:hypothetical protein